MEIHTKTRNVYDKQHKRVLNDKKTMKRFLNMIQESYFGLETNYFNDKKLIDVGCGNAGYLLMRFHDFGCTDLTGLELGDEFKKDITDSLLRYNNPKEHFKLVSGSVLDLPFEDNSFDFVSCHGVLLHLNDLDEVKKGFAELTRICKRNGYLYVVGGVYGGLLEYIYPKIREYYRKNEDFKNLIDNLHPDDFQEVASFVKEKILKHERKEINLEFLKDLFDEDLCITTQNILQAPVRLQISEELFRGYYEDNGFGEIRRLKRYVKRENIRSFFSPLHYYRDNQLSKVLYGAGNLEFIGKLIQ